MAKDLIILAAGIGSRLRPLTNEMPKTMVQVGGKTIIERLLLQLKPFLEELNICVVAGYLGDVLEQHLNEIGVPVKIIKNVDYNTTNNMYSLWLAMDNIKSEKDLIIVNADCVYEDEIVSSVIRSEKSIIAVDKSIYNDESMKVRLNRQGYVQQMSKQIEEGENVHVSVDIYSLTKEDRTKLYKIVNDTIENENLNSWTEVALDELSRSDQSDIEILDITGLKWMEIDNHSDLDLAQTLFS